MKNIFLAFLLVLTSAVFVNSAIAADDDSRVSEPLSQAELEQILAPIALYPDTVLSHILIAATYPLEVIQAERWTVRNPDLTGSDAVEAVNDEEWDPSVRALVAFPQILSRLSEDLEWTQRLGDAFLQDEENLLSSVQELRQRAYDAGNLDDLEQLSVTREQQSIVIEPREREVVYVPYYDTRTVYGPWSWADYPPTYWDNPYYDHHYVSRHHRPFYWGPRVHISFGFFFSSFHWGNRHIVRIPYHHYRPRHYYNHHQIVRHHNARRWGHDPFHRRGVAYQNINVSNRYHHGNRGHRGNRQNSRVDRSPTNQSVVRIPDSQPSRVLTTRNPRRSEHRGERLGHDTSAYRSNSGNQNRTIRQTNPRPAQNTQRSNRPNRPAVQPRATQPRPPARNTGARPAPASTPRAAPPPSRPVARQENYKKPAAQRRQAIDEARPSKPATGRGNRRVQPR